MRTQGLHDGENYQFKTGFSWRSKHCLRHWCSSSIIVLVFFNWSVFPRMQRWFEISTLLISRDFNKHERWSSIERQQLHRVAYVRYLVVLKVILSSQRTFGVVFGKTVLMKENTVRIHMFYINLWDCFMLAILEELTEGTMPVAKRGIALCESVLFKPC